MLFLGHTQPALCLAPGDPQVSGSSAPRTASQTQCTTRSLIDTEPSFSHKWSLSPGRVNAERLLVTFQIEHLAKLGNPAPCALRNGGRRLTSVRGPRDAEGGVEATVEALSGVGQDELLQPRVQQEGVGPVHTHHGQVAVHRQRAAELRRCGRGVSVSKVRAGAAR